MAPSYSCAHEDRAIFLALIGRRAEALAEIAKIDQLDYGFSSAWTEQWTYYTLRDYPNLIGASRRGLLLDPKVWFQHYSLGIGYEGTGKLQDAISEYQQAIAMSGDSRSTVALAHAYSAMGKKAEAENILRDLEHKLKQTSASPDTDGHHLRRPRPERQSIRLPGKSLFGEVFGYFLAKIGLGAGQSAS